MNQAERLDRLEGSFSKLLSELDELKSREQIRDCIYRASRGTDRVDANLLASSFHPDATVDMGRIYEGPVEQFIQNAIAHQAGQTQRQHLVANILIRIQGEEAVAESYTVDRHKTPINGEVRDLVLACRNLDRFQRRDGEWRIVERQKVMDWGRSISADEGPFVNGPLPHGGDDRSDRSYALLP
jgi:hypothetical protein